MQLTSIILIICHQELAICIIMNFNMMRRAGIIYNLDKNQIDMRKHVKSSFVEKHESSRSVKTTRFSVNISHIVRNVKPQRFLRDQNFDLSEILRLASSRVLVGSCPNASYSASSAITAGRIMSKPKNCSS